MNIMDRIARHELFEYTQEHPYHLFAVFADSNPQGLTSHWHRDLEIVYTVAGNNRHVINGKTLITQPGQLITINSDFIHSIFPDERFRQSHVLAAFVIILNYDFLMETFPSYSRIYFQNSKVKADPEIDKIILRLLPYAEDQPPIGYSPCQELGIRALLTELLYLMTQQGIIERASVDKINVQKNIERMKGVAVYIEDHYREHLSQEEVAEHFHFTPAYFSRYFKKCMGIPFTKYLANYRSLKARELLLASDMPLSEISDLCGFTDERRLILAFRSCYGTTPRSYRISHRNK